MAQGLNKTIKKGPPKKPNGIMKKGAVQISPKHKGRLIAHKITKKLSGKIIANTEVLLAPKAAATGRLRILANPKPDAKDAKGKSKSKSK